MYHVKLIEDMEFEMPTPCQHCLDVFDLHDGRASKKWYKNTIICKECANEERKEIDFMEKYKDIECEIDKNEEEIDGNNERIYEIDEEIKELKTEKSELLSSNKQKTRYIKEFKDELLLLQKSNYSLYQLLLSERF